MPKRHPSIIQDKKECFVTGSTKNLDCHHCLDASRRALADKYGLWVWLRHDVHMSLHGGDSVLAYSLKRLAQTKFEEHHSRKRFVEIFGKNYLDGDIEEEE